MASIRLPISIDPTVYQTLVSEADGLGLSLTAYIRMILIRHGKELKEKAKNNE
jgi:hypothetical protein